MPNLPTDKDLLIKDEFETLIGDLDDEIYDALRKLSKIELLALVNVFRKTLKEEYIKGYSDAHNIVHFEED